MSKGGAKPTRATRQEGCEREENNRLHAMACHLFADSVGYSSPNKHKEAEKMHYNTGSTSVKDMLLWYEIQSRQGLVYLFE